MPAFIKTGRDENVWKKAKQNVVRRHGMTDSQYWGSVTSVYKKMGGAVKHGEKMCMSCGAIEKCKCPKREMMCVDDEMLGKSGLFAVGKKVLLIKAGK